MSYELVSEIIKEVDFDGRVYNVAVYKDYYSMNVIINVELSKATPYAIKDNKIPINFNFLITHIVVRSETNGLAGFILKVGGNLYPAEFYYCDASNDMKNYPLGQYARGFYGNAIPPFEYNVDIKIEKGSALEFLVYNDHTAAQKLYIKIYGYRITKKILGLSKCLE